MTTKELYVKVSKLYGDIKSGAHPRGRWQVSSDVNKIARRGFSRTAVSVPSGEIDAALQGDVLVRHNARSAIIKFQFVSESKFVSGSLDSLIRQMMIPKLEARIMEDDVRDVTPKNRRNFKDKW